MRKLNNILVTGGAGFIGSNYIRFILSQSDFSGKIINVDSLTYAGNLESLIDISKKENYYFHQVDIVNQEDLEKIFDKYDVDTVVHFAAESHVDRSIDGPSEFIKTNILGTFSLLEVCRKKWINRDDVLFHHISTDEVYGSLNDTGYFEEDTPYDPRSPYSASKASSDHLVRAYYHTYNIPFTLSNCSNNYGPYQFPEKLIPVMIEKMIKKEALPVYGDGKNIRDWLFVEDHNRAIWLIMNKGKTGESYNIGGENEWENIKLVRKLCSIVAHECDCNESELLDLISFIKDRPGHDRRYAIDCSKIKSELGWSQTRNFEQGLKETVKWYFENKAWVKNIQSGEYQKWMEKNYQNR